MAQKPTEQEYNTVYEGLRQASIRDFNLLRDFILSLTSGGIPAPISILYADLLALVTGNTLVPGQSYRITDFRSREQIPNTIDIQLGAIEPLLVLALDTNTLADFARTEQFPQDLIQYELQSIAFGADRGAITKRTDTERDNSANYDFRNFVFRRWETAPASGIFTVVTDNGGVFVDVPGFVNALCTFVRMEAVSGQLSNNVLFLSNNGISFAPGATENTLLGNNQSIVVAVGCTGNVIDDATGFCSLGAGVIDCSLGRTNTLINIGPGSERIITGSACTDITLGETNLDWIFGNNCFSIRAGRLNSFVELLGNGERMDFGDSNSNIILAVSSQQLRFGHGNDFIFSFASVLIDVEFGDNNTNFTFNGACQRMIFGDQNDLFDFNNVSTDWVVGSTNTNCTADANVNITIGQSCNGITMGSGSESIQYFDNTNGCTVGNNSEVITFGMDTANVQIGDSCTNITIEQDVQTIIVPNDTSIWRVFRDKIEASFIYSFAVQGGAVGTISFGAFPDNATLVNSQVLATIVPTTGGPPATLDMGLSISDPTNIFNSSSAAALFDGTVQTGTAEYGNDASWGLASSGDDIELVIGANPLITGRIIVSTIWQRTF